MLLRRRPTRGAVWFTVQLLLLFALRVGLGLLLLLLLLLLLHRRQGRDTPTGSVLLLHLSGPMVGERHTAAWPADTSRKQKSHQGQPSFRKFRSTTPKAQRRRAPRTVLTLYTSALPSDEDHGGREFDSETSGRRRVFPWAFADAFRRNTHPTRRNKTPPIVEALRAGLDVRTVRGGPEILLDFFILKLLLLLFACSPPPPPLLRLLASLGTRSHLAPPSATLALRARLAMIPNRVRGASALSSTATFVFRSARTTSSFPSATACQTSSAT